MLNTLTFIWIVIISQTIAPHTAKASCEDKQLGKPLDAGCVDTFQQVVKSLDSSEFEEIEKRLLRASKGKPKACPLEDLSKNEFLVIFDGANGFCPFHFEIHRPANVPTGQIKNYLLEQKKDDPYYPLREWMKKEMNQENRKQNCALIESLLDKQRLDQDMNNKRQVMYYSKDDDKEAFECARKIIQNRKQNGLSFPVFRAMGYSMGGEAAIEFASRMKEFNHPIETGLTIDPVGRGLRWTKSVIDKKNTKSFDVTGLFTKSWINTYQRLDKSQIMGAIGTQGRTAKGATKDIDFSDYMKKINPVYRKRAHTMMLEMPQLRLMINEWLYP